MAQPPKAADTAKDVLSNNTRSHGRGGAGNITNKPPTPVHADDLKTPTIKSNTYTTGRGGSGNMAKNDLTNPDQSRAAQDVVMPDHHSKDMSGTYHWGRGGEGNMTTVGKSGADQAREKSQERKKSQRALSNSKMEKPEGVRRGSFNNAIEKGKAMLGLARKESTPDIKEYQDIKESESAIE